MAASRAVLHAGMPLRARRVGTYEQVRMLQVEVDELVQHADNLAVYAEISKRRIPSYEPGTVERRIALATYNDEKAQHARALLRIEHLKREITMLRTRNLPFVERLGTINNDYGRIKYKVRAPFGGGTREEIDRSLLRNALSLGSRFFTS